MEIFNKIKWTLTLLLIFFLILATNSIDKKNFGKIKSSVVTIFEDRIVANDLIFEYLLLIHEKELALVSSNKSFFTDRNVHVNERLRQLNEQYKVTKLTPKEAIVFGDLRNDLEQLLSMEEKMDHQPRKENYHSLIKDIKVNLNKLSKIQLEEGRKQMALSKNTFKEVESFTRLENYCLIALAILLPLIIFASPRPFKKAIR